MEGVVFRDRVNTLRIRSWSVPQQDLKLFVPVAAVKHQYLAANFGRPVAHRAKEIFSDLAIVCNNPVMPFSVAFGSPRHEQNVQQTTAPKHVEPSVLGLIYELFAGRRPVDSGFVEDSGPAYDRAQLRPRVPNQVKGRERPFDYYFVRVQS